VIKKRNPKNGRIEKTHPAVRFFMNVEVVESGCWEWRGRIEKNGYARFYDGEKRIPVHRWMYREVVGELGVPPDMTIDHICGNRKCVNPQHLEQVSMRENLMRGNTPARKNAEKTHCKRGHPFFGENLKIKRTTGERICRECERERWEKARKKKHSL
jgi:hypothetical protein